MEYPRKPKEDCLRQERLKEMLEYSPETGVFTWKKSSGRVKAGAKAGWTTHNGYLKIAIDKVEYTAHRLAWFYTYNKWPTEDLDHINGERQNNKLSNLREATRSQNLQNKGKQCNNTSGFIGVSYNKSRGKWDARLKVCGKQICLGLFETAEEASKAYETESSKHFKEFKLQRKYDN